jgi:hypothetical protein
LAEVEARAVVAARPSFGEGWLVLGEALLGQRKLEEIGAVCGLFGSSTGAQLARTILDAKRRASVGEHASATVLIDDALHANPANHMLLKTKAQLLFEQGQRGEELRSIVRQILSADPLCIQMSAMQRDLSRATFGSPRLLSLSERSSCALGPLLPLA